MRLSSFFAFIFCLVVFSLGLFPASVQADSDPVVPLGGQVTFDPTQPNGITNPLIGSWEIDNSAGYIIATTTNNGSNAGWTVSYSGTISIPGKFTVTAPATATADKYLVSFSLRGSHPDDYYGAISGFLISPIKPLAHTGAPFTWEGGMSGVNLACGNMLTQVPITGWTARGGLSVSFALSHNSQSARTGEIAPKWIGSYDVTLSVAANKDATVTWGDEQFYTFTYRNYNPPSATYLAPSGINDALTLNNTTPPTYDLKTTDQVTYHFTQVDSTHWHLDNIQDEHSNKIQLTYTSGLVTQVADPSGRLLKLAYSSGKLSTVTDPLPTPVSPNGRVWTLNYSGGELASITNPTLYDYPTVGAASKTNLTGLNIAFGYDAVQNINDIKDKNGNHVGSTYSGNKLTDMHDAVTPANATHFDYYTTSSVITDANNHQTTYNYADGRVVSVQDTAGYTAYTKYDPFNNVKSVKDKNGKTTSYGYTGDGLTSSVTDPLGHQTSTSYTSTNKPDLVDDSLHHHSTVPSTTPHTYTYDANDNLSTATDALNRTTYYDSYNSYGLPLTIADGVQHANGYSSTLIYDTYGNPTKTVDANGCTSLTTYNILGWKTSATTGLPSTSTGDMSAVQTGSIRYDEWGRVKSAAGPPADGIALYRSSSADGHCYLTSDLSEYGSNLMQSSPYWQAVGPVGGVYTSPLYGTTALYRFVKGSDYAYRTTTTLSGYTLDTAHSLNGVSGLVGYVYTAQQTGNTPLYEAYNGTTGLHLYTDDLDEINRLPGGYVKSVNPICYVICSTTQTNYDANGNVLSVLDPNGVQVVTSAYDADDRLLTRYGGNGAGETVSYTYDTDTSKTGANLKGHVAYKTDGKGHRFDYWYTVRGELRQAQWPLQQAAGQSARLSETYTYDPDGRTVTRTKRDGHTVESTYDAAGRLTDVKYYINYFNANGMINPSRSLTSTPAVNFVYDAADRRTQMTDGTGITLWDYENNNLLKKLTTPNGSITYTHNDGANRLTLRTMATDGTGTKAWGYGYDGGNRLTSLSTPGDGTTTFHYDFGSRVYEQDGGDGEQVVTVFNAAGMAADIKHLTGGGALEAEFANTYEAAGHLIQHLENEGVPSVYSTTAYTYDNDYQLRNEARTGGPSANRYSIAYTYDANHNRTTTTKSGTTEQYTYDDADELTERDAPGVTTRAYQFDVNGNQNFNLNTTLANHGTSSTDQTYDDADRMTLWHNSAGKVNTLVYNGLGLRVQKTDGTGTDTYLCDGAGPASPVLTDGALQSAGSTVDGTGVYTQGLSQTVYSSSANTWSSTYVHSDALGSLRLTTDNTQSLSADRLVYDAFGNIVAKPANAPASPLKFAGTSGYLLDSDSNLELCGSRYYNPATGRFMTSDPAGAGDNWYTYVGNNPLTATDPTGMFAYGSGGRHDVGVEIMSGLASDNGLENARFWDESKAMAMQVDLKKLEDEAYNTPFKSTDAIAKWILKDAIGFTDYYGVEVGSFILKDGTSFTLDEIKGGTGISGSPKNGGSAGDTPLGVAPWDAVGDWHTHVHAPAGFGDNFFSRDDIHNAELNNFQHPGWCSYLGIIDTAVNGSAIDYKILKYDGGTRAITPIWSGPPNPHSSI